MIVRFYLQSAYTRGYKDHPQIVMKQLGFKVLKGVPETIADLWFFEVEDTENVPDWIDVMDEAKIKALPEWPK